VKSAQAALAQAEQPNTSQDMQQASASLMAAEGSLWTTEHPSTALDIQTAQAQLSQAETTLQTDKKTLSDDTELRAPVSGTVLAVNVQDGGPSSSGSSGGSAGSSSGSASTSTVSGASSAGSSGAVVIGSGHMTVVANVEEVDIGTMQVGDPVAMTFNAFPNSVYTGKVMLLPTEGTTASSVTTYPVAVSLVSPTTGLTPGMTANLTIVTKEVNNAVEVPNLAVTATGFGSFVTTVNAHDQIVRTPVQTGVSDLTNTQILSGITPGERVIEPLGTLGSGGGGGGSGGGAGGAGGGGGRGGFGGGSGLGGALRGVGGG
jgi:macrolide-specific efflux system membrane fusion protein